MPALSLTSEYDGILMYVIHQGGQAANQIISDANQVWFEENEHVSASMYGVAETNIEQHPDAEILQQTQINRLPTILFVRVSGGQMTAILSRKDGTVPQSRIRSEFKRLLNREPVYESGAGGSKDEWIDGNGEGGLGIGKCSSWMPDFICGLPTWMGWLALAIIIIFLAFKFRK